MTTTSRSSPTLAQFTRHAQIFGAECVFETASDNGFSDEELERLRIELDSIQAARKRGHFTVGRRRRRTPDETLRAIRQLRDEGLVVAAIADKLGITDSYVKRCLSGSSITKNGVANLHGYAADSVLNAKAR